MTTRELLLKANSVKSEIMTLDTEKKNSALQKMADALLFDADEILKENAKDIDRARGSISDVMIDRLMLNRSRIEAMADGIRNVAKLSDPVGKTLSKRISEDELEINKVSVPFGVIAIIYESRPNVTSDAAALCIKSGNVCVLRGGKEAAFSSNTIVKSLRRGLIKAGLSEDIICIVEDTSRESAAELMKARGLVDLLIPRGGAGLIRACVEGATVPCIETGTGICSIFVDKSADIDKAINIIDNAKTQRPSVCNAAEQLLIHRNVADMVLPALYERLVKNRIESGFAPVELRADEEAFEILESVATENPLYIKTAVDEDYNTEFLDYILAVKIVGDVAEATKHIEKHSTHHSEAIITEDADSAAYFTSHVDSAAVYVNASTRFTDGGMFGLGCEMGIATQKLHARGPMGLEELTTYKYIVTGEGHIRK